MKTKIQIIKVTLIIILLGFSEFKNQAQPVRVDGGLIEGIVENNIIIYKGIPFAAPPINEFRWRPPQPVHGWDGVMKTDKFAPACPQFNMPMIGYTNYGTSEDCLYLNIWKPNNYPNKKLPVMVWIHGGGFSIGSTSQALTTGEQLASKGVIIVSIAYRLGALGFLSHPDLSAESEMHVSGNYGLLDQIAGLKWIKRNIKSFGGDTDNITIFGESAGGQSVSMLAASPLAKGLFHKAICMSGGSFGPLRMKKEQDCMQFLKGAEKTGVEFCKRMGANSINELRKINPEKFLSDSTATIGGFWPVADGYVITDDQYKLYESGKYNDVPVMVGFTSDEGSIFIMQSKPDKYTETTYKNFGPFADKILKIYPDSTEEITKRSMADLFRDSYFGWYTYAWAKLQTKTGKSAVFAYYFDQPQPPSFLTLLLKSDKAYHGSDCAYVFKHLDQNSNIKYTDEDRQLSELMVSYWTNFAKNGNPNGKGLPEWSAYSQNNQIVMYFNNNPALGLFPNIDRIEVIDNYYTWKRDEGDSK